MPSFFTKLGVLSIAGDYKPGDPPPAGYADWHEWAKVQDRAKLKQEPCGLCGLWRFPQEMGLTNVVGKAYTARGKEVRRRLPVCLACDANRPRPAQTQE